MIRRLLVVTTLLATPGIGCKPSYEDMRPPVDQIDHRDRGLQSKDVVNASDKMAAELLALPALNKSDRPWRVTVTGVRNRTVTVSQNLDVFVQRLKSKVYEQGRDRVEFIANREDYRQLQSAELELPNSEREGPNGQSPDVPGPVGIQPDFILEAVAADLGGQGTDYYNFEFRMIDLRTRQQVWTGMYEVRVAR